MKAHPALTTALCTILIVPLTMATIGAMAAPMYAATTHVPNMVLGQRTDGLNVGGDDFTGAIPANDGTGTLLASINVDTEAAGLASGVDLSGDNHDWAFTFHYSYTEDAFSFRETDTDPVQCIIYHIV